MKYIRPNYYKSFKCIASECPDTCCAGWEIAIDKKALKKYQEVEGAFGNRLYNSINWNRASFQQYENQCIFLNEEHLCDIYSEAGAEMLCKTCKNYPRHIEEYEGVKEVSLGLSCPEVARLILSRTERVTYEVYEKEKNQKEFVSFNQELFQALESTRERGVQILQNRVIPCSKDRLAMYAGLGHDIQKRIQSDSVEEIEQILSNYDNSLVVAYLVRKVEGYQGRYNEKYAMMKDLMKSLSKMKVLNRYWTTRLKEAQDILYNQGELAYETILKRFEKWQKSKECSLDWNLKREQLAVYFNFGYICSAVYDEELYEKVKFVISNTLLIQELVIASWRKNGEEMTEEEVIEITYLYAREIEHLNENLSAMEKIVAKKKYQLEDWLIACMN